MRTQPQFSRAADEMCSALAFSKLAFDQNALVSTGRLLGHRISWNEQVVQRPFCGVSRLDASTIRIKVFGWVDQGKSDFGKVHSEAIRAVKSRFDDGEILTPAPIQNIRAIGEPASKADEPRTIPSEVENIADTKADLTLEQKVHDIRSDAGEDLLTADAPRE